MSAQRTVITATATGANAVRICGGQSKNIQTVAVQISGTLTTVSILFKGRMTADGNLTNSDLQTMGYTTPANGTVAATAITAAGIFWVRADGMDIYADCTITAGGPVNFDVIPLNG